MNTLAPKILHWAPFKLDALGLVTMLAAGDVNRAIGSLQRSWCTEFLPFLGTFVVASDQIIEQDAGYIIYNVTDYISTTDVKGWLTRWLQSQRFKSRSRTMMQVEVLPESKDTSLMDMMAFSIGSVIMVAVLLFTIFIGDWYGFANAVGMVISVVVRRLILEDLRSNLDETAVASIQEPHGKNLVKALIVMPDGTIVSVRAPRGVMTKCFTRSSLSYHPYRYIAIQSCGWIAFVVQVVTLGMCSLVVQLYTILLLVGGSVLLIQGVGSDHFTLGTRLSIQTEDFTEPDRRLWAYVHMNLELSQEEFLITMGIMPTRANKSFWGEFYKAKACTDLPGAEVDSQVSLPEKSALTQERASGWDGK